METMKQAAHAALDIQSACNLSGVAHAFSRAMTVLSAEGLGTEAKNSHPISVLFAVQIAHLTGHWMEIDAVQYRAAVDACEALAEVTK